MVTTEKNTGFSRTNSSSASSSTSRSTERTPLLPPIPTAIGHGREDGPPALANPEGALNVKPARRKSSAAKKIADSEGHTSANQSLTAIRGTCVFFALGCLVFIVATNMSILTTTQSAIAPELGAIDETAWFTSAFLIAMSALGPLNGKLSAIFSPRLCIFVASLLMAIGSLACAWSTNAKSFILARAISGVGASGIFTISIIIVLELTGSKRKGIAVGMLNSGYTVGVAVGATGAGALVDTIGWRSLFWLQAPITVFGGLVILMAIPGDFTAGKQDPNDADRTTWERLRRLDYLGAITLTASLVLMLYALSSPNHIPILPVILSVMIGIAFVPIEAYWAFDPVIPVTLLKSRGLLLTCLGTVGYMMARWSILFYTPTYAIAVRQWSASIGGSLLIPTNAGFAAGGLLVGWFHIRRNGSFYIPTLVSYGLFPVTLFVMAMMAHRESSPIAFIIVLFVCGSTTGAALNYSLAHLLHITPTETHYVATALIATCRGFAGSFGSAVGGGLFSRTLSASLSTRFAEHGMERDDLVRRLLSAPALVSRLEGVEQEVAIKGYEDGLKTLWLGAALLALIMVLFQAGTGWTGDAEKQALKEERQALLHDEDSRDREEATRATVDDR